MVYQSQKIILKIILNLVPHKKTKIEMTASKSACVKPQNSVGRFWKISRSPLRQLFENFTPRVELLFSFQFDHAIHKANTKSGIDAINGAFSNSNYGVLQMTLHLMNHNDLNYFLMVN